MSPKSAPVVRSRTLEAVLKIEAWDNPDFLSLAKSVQNRTWHSPRFLLYIIQNLREISVLGHVILIVYLFTAKRN